MPAVALTIAGSDPSGGAGIQADLKTFHQFGVYGEAVITLLTVQNTRAVSRVHTLDAVLVAEQLQAAIADIPPAAAKTGALGTIEIIEAVAALAASFQFPLIVDPVMVSKHGARLLAPEAEIALRRKLLPRAFLVTPNLYEAEALTGLSIRAKDDMYAAAQRLFDFGCPNVLIKGGHLPGQPVDLLYGSDGAHFFDGTRVETHHTHGTGCVYSAAITAGLALGRSLRGAVAQAKDFVQRAIETAPGLGAGNGPLNFNTSVP
jgi:hydroxymethylpyrimidine/phosphomethylpyrimidine kinase